MNKFIYLICVWSLTYTLFLAPMYATSSSSYRCPVITRTQLTEACWGKTKRSMTKGMSIYGVKCPGLGLGKKLSIRRNQDVDKIYQGTFLRENTPEGLSRIDPVCAYPIHQLGRQVDVQIAIVDSSYKKSVSSQEPQGQDSSELMEGLDERMRPFLPYDSSSGSFNTNQITPLALEGTDREFVEQTGGGIKRAIGTGKLLLLVRQQYVYGYDIQRLSQQDREKFADQLFIKFFGGSQSSIIQNYQRTGEIAVDDLETLYETVKRDIFDKYDWNITPETWNNREKPLDVQFKEEIKVFLNTLFPSPENVAKIKLTPEEKNEEIRKLDFLKRLFITLAWLEYTPTENGEDLQPWPFTLASSLGRGGRVLVVSPDKNIQPTFNYLMNGDSPSSSKQKPIYEQRSLASHGIGVTKEGFVIETKLKGLTGLPQNISSGLKGYHLGINIPVGGLGSPQIDKALVGMDGFSINPVTGQLIPKRQHGHVYINYNPNLGAFLIGIELSAPGYTNMFGGAHTVKGGFGTAAEETSLTGGDKWPVIKTYQEHPAPHGYGGKRITITTSIFNLIKRYYRAIEGLSYEDQRLFFKKFLPMNAQEAQRFLRVFYATLSIPGVPDVDDILDPKSPNGLNLEMVHRRQILMRDRGYADDISTKIVLLQTQLSGEEKLKAQRQQLEKERLQPSLSQARTSQLTIEIQNIDQKLAKSLQIKTGVIKNIQEILALTDQQIQAIPGYENVKTNYGK